MGFFNAMSSIGKINDLLKEMEYQLKIVGDMTDNNVSSLRVQQEVDGLIKLYNQIGSVLENSSGARTAVYTFLGRKCRSWEILSFLNETIRELKQY
ncbi:MAG: hypothetical protein IJM43_06280 [Bacteroidaceae bacterium]|nr:hypothetical protein [Bacteroidaceae bacterium]